MFSSPAASPARAGFFAFEVMASRVLLDFEEIAEALRSLDSRPAVIDTPSNFYGGFKTRAPFGLPTTNSAMIDAELLYEFGARNELNQYYATC